MRYFYFIILILVSIPLSAQVGVGTDDPDPDMTLDINGKVKIRTIDDVSEFLSDDRILFTTLADGEVKQISLEALISDINSSNVNTTIAKGLKSNGVTLLSAATYANWQRIDFTGSNITIDEGPHFSTANDYYLVPEDGIYAIGYYFRYGTGVQASVLSSTPPKMGILRYQPSITTYTVLDQREFAGVNLSIAANITISNSEINSFYRLNANDHISFHIDRSGVNLNLLGTSKANFYVYKISD
ncbi:hypothetical protein [Zunongwangia atlantica]|uniref:C1q domain-containing protein n=1 Tax=Zunongwangia atlantica 22II14-10F7 TaxID=1185767 RepID=A0A1Y1SZ10_9FLAO|nr:hypothetical protein [Zunongwangia atlantica]ORL43987.1 hypothetical protein IIF7_17967 [Zunongwangia atlantica 22II14-10F7]